MIKHTSKLCTIAIITMLAGCASPAQMKNMSVNSESLKIENDSPLRKNMTVRTVTGGSETNPMWTSQVSSKDLKGALTSSFKATELQSDNPNARYALDAAMIELNQPFIGLNMTVKSTIDYTVIDTKTNSVVFDESISAPFTASPGDSLVGMRRLRLANEGAIRENITKLIKELQDLEL